MKKNEYGNSNITNANLQGKSRINELNKSKNQLKNKLFDTKLFNDEFKERSFYKTNKEK
jgi:hypothetical protein